MRQSTSSWRLLVLAALLPILVLVAIDVSMEMILILNLSRDLVMPSLHHTLSWINPNR